MKNESIMFIPNGTGASSWRSEGLSEFCTMYSKVMDFVDRPIYSFAG